MLFAECQVNAEMFCQTQQLINGHLIQFGKRVLTLLPAGGRMPFQPVFLSGNIAFHRCLIQRGFDILRERCFHIGKLLTEFGIVFQCVRQQVLGDAELLTGTGRTGTAHEQFNEFCPLARRELRLLLCGYQRCSRRVLHSDFFRRSLV